MEIYVKNISKKFKREVVFENISFKIDEGERILFYGRNGAGKTTLLKILNFLEKPTSGEIVYISNEIYSYNNNSGRNIEFQKKMIFIPQPPVIFSSSLIENIKIGLKIRKERKNEEDIKRILEMFGIWKIKNQLAHTLSSGQKQKVSLIRGLLLDTELILLDEPTNNLDEKGKEVLKEILNEKKKMGVSCIITTPDLREWEDFYFDKIYRIEKGSLNDISTESKENYMGSFPGFIYRKS